MNNDTKDLFSIKEEKIIESYNRFLSQIDVIEVKKKGFYNKVLFIISIILFLYGGLSSIGDISLIIEFFDTSLGVTSCLISLILSIILFVVACKRKIMIENNCKLYYKCIWEEILNIEFKDDLVNDDDFEKLSKKEYINVGFDFADEKYGYYYESYQKILIDNYIEAFLIQIYELNGKDNDIPSYIVDGWITKQKININKKYTIDVTDDIIKQFNKEYNCNIKNNIKIRFDNGYLYILMEGIDLNFSYLSLIEYDVYKRIYLNLRLITDLSKFICININKFL